MVEPFYDANMGGTVHTKMWAQRFSDLREQALKQPKFGTDNRASDHEVCDHHLLGYSLLASYPGPLRSRV